MGFDIAVYENENGETAALNVPGKLVVYRKRQGSWKTCREKRFNPNSAEGMVGLRRMMDEMTDVMGSCKIFVGHTVTGIPYFELEKSDCTVWEMQGKPGDFLDYILSCEDNEQSLAEKSTAVVIPVPAEIGEGRYLVSIKEIQDDGGGITSKQVLQPFLRRENFFELEVICSHVPPWLEAEFAAGVLKGEILEGGKKIIISKKCCNEL
ncbi:Fe-only nitrogenase accessory protein AnfO [Desulfotomaculum arcticum]|uniref:Fe-only nitrogenase accessory protein AnfO n=1 Tax=Desulfotruncus arcticus DSM 17038 TaxID=1121424 RepID=A0A1I2QAI1_9FIRM|nr:Fe-only nitrogenase accessory AnfO family protein [Desulfotruncus arcticus]SFG23277.1 Fe-only nitrogenase accessory protein AnfO [Desulfotomaculum arcticum] [Desulfotruncus arcticus DSM 17038]